MEKKNTGLIVLVIILSLSVVALSGYIVYDKALSKDNNVSTDDNSKDDITNGTENNISWYDYLISQEFVSASLKVCSIDGKHVHYKGAYNQATPGVSRNITEDELKNILNTLYKSESKNPGYSEIIKGGYSEPACINKISYKYTREDKEYEFILNGATIIVTEDEEFIKILENNMNSYQSYALNRNTDKYNELTEDMMIDYVDYY